MLTPKDMERISAEVYPDLRQRTGAEEFDTLLSRPNIFAVTRPDGFLIFQVAGPEADIHSFAVAPTAQGKGIGAEMLRDGLAQLHARGVQEVYLEVDTSNLPAQKLYHRAGFFVIGDRPGYYRNGNGTVGNAYMMGYYYGKEDLIGAASRFRLAL